MKKLLVLAAGILQLPVIKKAKEMGYYVIAADGDSRSLDAVNRESKIRKPLLPLLKCSTNSF